MTDKISIGAIGCGSWGYNYVRVFSELPDSEVLVCADLDQNTLERIKKIHPSVKIVRDYEEVLKDSRVEAVAVSTPASSHYEVVKACLLHGKHVLVEKPFTVGVKEAEELVDLAQRKSRVLMVGHIFRYNPAILRLKGYVDRGELGDIIYVHASRTGLGPIRNDVNVMWDLAPHDVSTLLYLLGSQPLDVNARGEAYLRNAIEDVVFVAMRFPRKILAYIHVSWLDPTKVRRTTVIGSKKMAVFDDVEMSEKLRLYDKGVSYEKPYSSFGEFQLLLRDGDITIPKVDTAEPLKNECKHFIECVKTGATPITDGAEGLKVVRVLAAAESSLKSGGQVVRLSAS